MKAKIVSMLLISMLLLSASLIFMPPAEAVTANVKVFVDPVEDGPDNAIGHFVDVAVAIENVANLYGFDIKLRWNTTYFDYVSKVVTVPVETYNTPQAPSPYAGILHEPFIKVKDIVYTSDGYYQLAIACQAPAAAFDGSGTAFTMRFVIKAQQWDIEGDYTLLFDFIDTKLSDQGAGAILHTREPGEFLLKGRTYVNPPIPFLDVRTIEGKTYTADAIGEQFDADIYLLGIDPVTHVTSALDPYWDVQGFDMYLNFDPTLVHALTSTIDPVGTFAGFWPGGLFTISNTINNVAGTVRMSFLGLPGPGGVHTAPFGTIKLATVKFNATYESETYPPPTCQLALENPDDKKPVPLPEWVDWQTGDFWMVKIAGFPHPERAFHPYDSKPWSPPIPSHVSDATYKAPFKPPGRWLDVYTEYPAPYGGQGPNQPSDAFQPQAEITFYASVTYNFDPVQQKTVSFQITSPTGEFIWIRQAISDTNGIATVSVRIPWPCEDPESRIFGIWHVVGTVDIAEVVVNDTLTFEMGYLINIVSVEPLEENYVKGEHMGFKITYDCISEQPHNGMFFVVVYDDLGVAIGYNRVWVYDIVEGTGYEVIIDCMTLPKWAFVGEGTVYANVLNGWPETGGVCYCPEHSATFGILRAP